MDALANRIFDLSPAVGYVSVYLDGQLAALVRGSLGAGGGGGEGEPYDEVVVNPTLIALAGQRGEMDGGGLEYVLVRYVRFHQLVVPFRTGHVAVSVEPRAEVMPLVREIVELLDEAG